MKNEQADKELPTWLTATKALMSTFKQLSHLAIALSNGLLSPHCTREEEKEVKGFPCDATTITNTLSTISNSTPNKHTMDTIVSGYGEIQTIRHATTFEKSKLIFRSRNFGGAFTDTAVNDAIGWTTVFDPIYVVGDDSRPIFDNCQPEGNVHFSLRSMNGPCGIWDLDMKTSPLRDSEDNIATDYVSMENKSSDETWPSKVDHIRYYVITPGSAEGSECLQTTHILVTRTEWANLLPYNPLCPGGPWYVQWDQERGAFIHFIMRRNANSKNNSNVKSSCVFEAVVRFHLDDSILGSNMELADQFARGTFVSFAECQTGSGRRSSWLVDNHVTTGPLRVILASSCYRWPGGIVLSPNGAFSPDRTLSRFHAFHARISREVLIQQGGDASRTVPEQQDEASVQRTQELLKVVRLATYTQLKTLLEEHSEIVTDVRMFLRKLSSGIEQLENLHALKRALQPFVLFLASNSLDIVEFMVTDSTELYEESELYDFETLYRFVLGVLPDRKSHQVFRDCLGARIAMAVDSN